MCQLVSTEVGNFAGIHYHSNFMTGLHSKGFLYTIKIHGQLFEICHTLYVLFEPLTFGSKSLLGEDIGYVDNNSFNRCEWFITVMGFDSGSDLGINIVFFTDLTTDITMMSLYFLIERFAYIVEKPCFFGNITICSHFSGDIAG